MKVSVDQAIIQLLDELMTKNRDAIEGYMKAVESISNVKVRNLFIRFAEQRRLFVSELKIEIKALGGDYVDKSSWLSTIHRMWMDITAIVTGNDVTAILRECLRGEEASLSDYQEANENEYLPVSSRMLINKHQAKIALAIQELNELLNNDSDSLNGGLAAPKRHLAIK